MPARSARHGHRTASTAAGRPSTASARAGDSTSPWVVSSRTGGAGLYHSSSCRASPSDTVVYARRQASAIPAQPAIAACMRRAGAGSLGVLVALTSTSSASCAAARVLFVMQPDGRLTSSVRPSSSWASTAAMSTFSSVRRFVGEPLEEGCARAPALVDREILKILRHGVAERCGWFPVKKKPESPSRSRGASARGSVERIPCPSWLLPSLERRVAFPRRSAME